MEHLENGRVKKGSVLQDYAPAIYTELLLEGFMKIHPLIFRELLKRGYSVEGAARVWNIADSKLEYITLQQAKTYLAITTAEDYLLPMPSTEAVLVRTHLSSIIPHLPSDSLTIIDLGCGNGAKAAFIISKLLDRTRVRYFPVDISGYMVETAIKNVTHLKNAEVVDVGWNISDFENLQNISRLFDKSLFKHNLFLLLGNTLSNFDIHELLYEIKESMHPGDFILLGNSLYPPVSAEEIIKPYQSNANYKRFFSFMPLQLGLVPEDISFDVRFRNSRIEFFFTLRHDVTVSFNTKTVTFFKGDQIIAGIFYRYPQKEFLQYLSMYFKKTTPYISDDGRYILALCQK